MAGNRKLKKPPAGFYVVGIGASAEGIEALKEFFGAMPADSGMAFVIVQHLEPRSESRMAEILAKCTTMKVLPAENGMPVEPNRVFTNPPGRAVTMKDGLLVLGQPAVRGGVFDRDAPAGILPRWQRPGHADDGRPCRPAQPCSEESPHQYRAERIEGDCRPAARSTGGSISVNLHPQSGWPHEASRREA